MDEKSFDKEFNIESFVDRLIADNQELLDRLGSDYDENGIPYWEKNDTGK